MKKTKSPPLTPKQVSKAIVMLNNFAPITVIARKLGVSYWLVYKLKIRMEAL